MQQLRRVWGSALGILLLALWLMPLTPPGASRSGSAEPAVTIASTTAARLFFDAISTARRGALVGITSRRAPSIAIGDWLSAAGPGPSPALAGPVQWVEVPASPEGRQWWDAGSLRRDRQGRLSVLSRYQPAASASSEPVSSGSPQGGSLSSAAASPRPSATAAGGSVASPASPSTRALAPSGSPADGDPAAAPQRSATLYVMELDCGQLLYRDISVNGLPRWRAEWVPAAGDSLTMATLRAACAAAGDTTPDASAQGSSARGSAPPSRAAITAATAS